MRSFPQAAALLRHGIVVAAGFIIVAVIVRAPALLYSVLNYDESMYLLMGLEFARGHLPYTTVCDLKPFGLFALATPFAASPFDPVISSRIGASVAVGLTAYLLCRVSGLLFSDEGLGQFRRQIAVMAL